MNRSIILHRLASLTSVALLLSSLPLAAETAVPGLMTYQAFVTDDANQPLAPAAPANYEVIFRIYDSATGDTVIWSEKQTVSIFQGNFSVLLGNGQVVGAEPKPEDLGAIFTAKERYMGITVGENAEFSPRQRILPNAYAYRAKVAESVGGVISLDGTSTSLSGALDVDGFTDLVGFRSEGNGAIVGTLGLYGAGANLFVNGAGDIDGNLDVDGHTHLDGFTSDGLATINSNLHVRHSINLDDRLNVDGNALFKGHVDIRNNFYVGVNNQGHDVKFFGRNGAYLHWVQSANKLVLASGAQLYVNGTADLAGGFSSGDGSINGWLTVNGAVDLNGWLDAGPLTVHNPNSTAEVNIRATAARQNAKNPVFKIEDKDANEWIKVGYGPSPHGNNPITNPHFEVVRGQVWKPGGGGWGNPSDERLKKNIKNLDGALDKLLKLRSVTYEYKDPKQRYYVAGKQTGFIAQEVEEVFPEWVQPLPFGPDEDEPDLKGVSVTGFPALSVQALRELRAEKDAQIDALKQANSALETRLARLEALLGNQGSGLKPVSGSTKESR